MVYPELVTFQFLFDPINYDELRHVYSSDEIAELYRPFRRYTEHCPAVLAEWRKRQRKGGKHHRNRYGDYGLFRSQSWNLDPYCNRFSQFYFSIYRVVHQVVQGGWPTGNGKKLNSCQAQLGQATCLAVA